MTDREAELSKELADVRDSLRVEEQLSAYRGEQVNELNNAIDALNERHAALLENTHELLKKLQASLDADAGLLDQAQRALSWQARMKPLIEGVVHAVTSEEPAEQQVECIHKLFAQSIASSPNSLDMLLATASLRTKH